MKTIMKSTFKRLSIAGVCMAFMPLLHANPIDVIESTVEYVEPKELCFNRALTSSDITEFTLDYVFTLPEADINQEGLIFVGFVFDNEPDKIYLRFRKNGGQLGIWQGLEGKNASFDWALYDPNVPLDESFVASNLAPIVPMSIVKQPMDLRGVNASGGGSILVGYGFKIHESDTVDEIFQEMLFEKRYSSVAGIRNSDVSISRGDGVTEVCVKTMSYTKKAPVIGLQPVE